ncbi:microcystin-dependent protein [Chitinophaga skermanii]|uniref:Microcystin-dependent protein n=2 Tax=Chitinophaga skermanii TaxID=331697 RepID=A0A327Q0G6_9BACT|nr:microcystin-dependent protein [Chitinophaga skermanii]
MYALMGIAFGGDGKTSFGIPDLRGRVAVGQGMSNYGQNFNMGDQGGQSTVTLSINEIPQHVHLITDASLNAYVPVNSSAGTTNNPTGNNAALGIPPNVGTGPLSRPINLYAPPPATVTDYMAKAKVSGNTAVAGSSMPHNNMQPFLTLNYVICTAGTFPSRP